MYCLVYIFMVEDVEWREVDKFVTDILVLNYT